LKTHRRKMVIAEFLPRVFPEIENSTTVRFDLIIVIQRSFF
jgi:hypothetical protein